MRHHLAQVNIGRIRGPMEGEVMREFREALDEINALAEASPGFVWRLKTDEGNATSIHAFPDPMLLLNLSVWESVETLQAYVYRSVHGKFFARRAQWFEKLTTPHAALWWVPAPSVGAFALTKGSKDSAVLAVLPAGDYTAQVTSASSASGTVLIEAYELQ